MEGRWSSSRRIVLGRAAGRERVARRAGPGGDAGSPQGHGVRRGVKNCIQGKNHKTRTSCPVLGFFRRETSVFELRNMKFPSPEIDPSPRPCVAPSFLALEGRILTLDPRKCSDATHDEARRHIHDRSCTWCDLPFHLCPWTTSAAALQQDL